MQQHSPGHEFFIADDDPAVRDTLSIVFSLEGFLVEGSAEGRSFLAAAHARTPACILLDVTTCLVRLGATC